MVNWNFYVLTAKPLNETDYANLAIHATTVTTRYPSSEGHKAEQAVDGLGTGSDLTRFAYM